MHSLILRRLPRLHCCPLSFRTSVRCFSENATQTTSSSIRQDLRNIAIVAHVDHGKTTLMDTLLKQCNALETSAIDGSSVERVMDSNTLEKERGVTILSKYATITEPQSGTRINIFDTPGHVDLISEVERVLSTVDGLLLVVDINEGPMPQTQFILSKANQCGIRRPIVFFNKVDRMEYDTLVNERFDDAQLEVMETLDMTGFSSSDIDAIMENRLLFGSAKSAFACENIEDCDPRSQLTDLSESPNQKEKNMLPLLSAMVEKIEGPKIQESSEFRMLAALVESDDFFGRLLVGKVQSGSLKVGSTIQSLNPLSESVRERNISVPRIFTRHGTKQVQIQEARAGDIIGIPIGEDKGRVFDTLCSLKCTPNDLIKANAIDRPTLSIRIMSNSGPLRGKDGSKVLIGDIGEWLEREAAKNVSVELVKLDENSYELRGRGELSLAVILETMRRDGYEFCIAAPRVMYREGFVDSNGNEIINDDNNGINNDQSTKNGSVYHLRKTALEPYENVTCMLPADSAIQVMEYLDDHGGSMKEYNPEFSKGEAKLVYDIPTRGLLGYETRFKSTTKGLGKFYRRFDRFAAKNEGLQTRVRHSVVSVGSGKATADAIHKLEPRCKGQMYIRPGDIVYEGMIIGESNRDHELLGNPAKTKEVTNIRTTRSEEHVQLKPAKELILEDVLCHLQTDELLEVTPRCLRLRKVELSDKARLQAKRRGVELAA